MRCHRCGTLSICFGLRFYISLKGIVCNIWFIYMFGTKRLLGGVSPESFCKHLRAHGTGGYFGVPNASLKGFTSYAKTVANNYVECGNEGNAVGMAIGHHMATGTVPLVFFPNTGLGNASNLLLSVASNQAEKIPLLLLISWRGVPDSLDFPQYNNIGIHIQNILTVLGIPFSILFPSDDPEFNTELVIDKAYHQLGQHRTPFAILAERDVFDNTTSAKEVQSSQSSPFSRREAVELVLGLIPAESVVVGGPGGISKDVAASRIKSNAKNTLDYLSIGSREHCSSIAEGIALSTPEKKVFCLEHGNSVSQFSSIPNAKNLTRILFRTSADLGLLPCAKALGYEVFTVESSKDLEASMKRAMESPNSTVVDIVVDSWSGGEEVIKYNGHMIMKQLQKSNSS